MLSLHLKTSKYFINICRLGFKKSLIEYKDYPEIRGLFIGEPMVTIHMNPKDRKDMS